MINFIKKSWKAVVSVVAAIIGLILLRQYFTKDLLAKLSLSKSDKDSAVIDEKVDAVKKEIASEIKDAQDLRDAASKPVNTLDPKAVEDYWNKK